MRFLEEQIREALEKATSTGSIRTAPSWGKPFDFDDGYEQTPAELRMGFKVLKDAGYVPAQVLKLKELEQLKQTLKDTPAQSEAAHALRRRITSLQAVVAWELERLKAGGG